MCQYTIGTANETTGEITPLQEGEFVPYESCDHAEAVVKDMKILCPEENFVVITMKWAKEHPLNKG